MGRKTFRRWTLGLRLGKADDDVEIAIADRVGRDKVQHFRQKSVFMGMHLYKNSSEPQVAGFISMVSKDFFDAEKSEGLDIILVSSFGWRQKTETLNQNPL